MSKQSKNSADTSATEHKSQPAEAGVEPQADGYQIMGVGYEASPLMLKEYKEAMAAEMKALEEKHGAYSAGPIYTYKLPTYKTATEVNVSAAQVLMKSDKGSAGWVIPPSSPQPSPPVHYVDEVSPYLTWPSTASLFHTGLRTTRSYPSSTPVEWSSITSDDSLMESRGTDGYVLVGETLLGGRAPTHLPTYRASSLLKANSMGWWPILYFKRLGSHNRPVFTALVEPVNPSLFPGVRCVGLMSSSTLTPIPLETMLEAAGWI